jgi:cytochrome P450
MDMATVADVEVGPVVDSSWTWRPRMTHADSGELPLGLRDFCPLEPAGYMYPPEPESEANPLDRLRELRRGCPVSRIGGGDKHPFTMVTRYEDCARVYRDHEAFSSIIGDRPTIQGHLDAPADQIRLVEMDEPAHRPVRRIMLTAVSPAAVAHQRGDLEKIARARIASFSRRGSADLVTEWAEPIPSTVIAHMIGVPVEDRKMFFDWTKKWVARLALDPTLVPGQAISTDFFDYLQHQIDVRRSSSNPPDDIFTRMMDLRGERGEALSDQEIKIETVFLLLAGNETTSNLMSSLMYRVLTEPGLYDDVMADRTLLPGAMEETLRFDPPIVFSTRYCRASADVAGVPTEPGDVMYLSITSANRDESVWGDDADEYNPRRRIPPKHLAFGIGPHACLGSHLAREMTLVAAGLLLDAVKDIRLAPGFRYEHRDYYQLHGPKHLPVTFTPADVARGGSRS